MIPKKIQNSKWFNVLLLLAAVFLSIAAYRSVRQSFQFRGETEKNKKKIEDLLKKKIELEQRIAELEIPEARERAAKERLNLKKPGEEVVVVLPDETKKDMPAENKSIWDRIKNFFGK